MANVSITLSGITEALENLNYRSGSVKDKAIRAISAYYVSEDSIQSFHTLTETVLSAGFGTSGMILQK